MNKLNRANQNKHHNQGKRTIQELLRRKKRTYWERKFQNIEELFNLQDDVEIVLNYK